MALSFFKRCSECLASNTLTGFDGGECLSCGSRFPRVFVIGYDEAPWDYTPGRIANFSRHDGLRLMSPYVGSTPERLRLLRHARELYLSRYRHFTFDYLVGFNDLTDFELDFTNVPSLEGIGALPSLRLFALTECRRVTDIAPIVNVPSIRYASFALCSQLRDYSPLASLPELVELRIEARTVASLAFLCACQHIEDLTLRLGKVEDEDFGPLFDLTWLRRLTLIVRGFKKKLLPVLRNALPDCTIEVDSYS